MNNPFTRFPIDNPKNLVGRSKLLIKLTEKINKGPVLLFGGRQFGKTSILKCLLAEYKENPNEKWIYWDAQSFDIDGGLKSVLKKQNIQSLEEIIQNSGRLVLIIDEFDVLGKDNRFFESDFQNLRALLSDTRGKFIIIAATSISQDRLEQQIKMIGSHILSVFRTFKLSALEVASSTQFYQEYFGNSDEFKEIYAQKKELFDLAGKWAGLHPALLLTAGDTAFNAENKTEYFEEIKERYDDIVHWGNNMIESSLSEFERMKLYLSTRVDIELEKSTFDHLGFTAHGIVPGAFELLIGRWFAEYLKKKPLLRKEEAEMCKKEFINKKFADIPETKYYELIQLINDNYVRIDNGIIKG